MMRKNETQSREHLIDDVLSRGVVDLIGKEELKKKLVENNKLIIKFGIDPTRPDIHLGHLVCIRKLSKFQELGCKVIFLIGDFTAQIGDPTGKSKVRPELDRDTVKTNMDTFVNQIDAFLDTKNDKHFEWIRNADWYTSINDVVALDDKINIEISDANGQKHVILNVEKNNIFAKAAIWFLTRMRRGKYKEVYNVSMAKFLSALRFITHSQLIERDMFQERLKKNEPLFMHEMVYPVLQGIDSTVIYEYWGSCDLEIGGTDQHFNMLIGRSLMKNINQSPQSVMTLNILEGTDGKEKMSKSLDNYIAVNEPPKEIFGKIMSLPDHLMAKYLELLTDLDRAEIGSILADHPRDAKLRLAEEICAMLHDKQAAEKARTEFLKVFSEKGLPADIPELPVPAGTYHLLDLVTRSGLCESTSDARRQITSGAVKIDDVKLLKLNEPVTINEHPKILQIGKRKFLRVIVE